MRHGSRFIKFAWKFGTQNLVVTCTLTLRQHLEYFLKSILASYISFRKSRSQESNTLNGVQIIAEIRKLCTVEANRSKRKVEFEIDNLSLKWFLAI